VSLLGDGEFAITESVPELDSFISTARDDLSVISGEGDGKDIVRVTYEATSGFAGVEIPKTESFIP